MSLVTLALPIGFFEAVFWRGRVLLRLAESFGIVPAIVLGSRLCAAYHIGYAMASSEIVILFFIGIMFALVLLISRSVLILWVVLHPIGQLLMLM